MSRYRADRTERTFWILFAIYGVVALTFWVGVIYIALHFIAKV